MHPVTEPGGAPPRGAAPSAGAGQRPWGAVPPDVAEALRGALPGAIAHVIEVVTAEVPAYAVTDARVTTTLRDGVGLALARLVELMGTQDEALVGSSAVYERIGAGEYRAGRGLADLLSAYQIGARAAWQSMSRASVAAGVSPADLAQLAEAVFAYIDQLSAASIAGYAQEQVADTGRREQVRSDLVARILAGEAGADRVAVLAEEVGWALPSMLMVVVPRGADLPAMVPGGVVGRTAQGPVALIGGSVTPALRGWLGRAGPPMAVGLAVPATEAARSAAQARALVGLPTPGTVLAVDHLPELLVGADPVVGAALRADVLAPFDAVPPGRREPLLDTLRSWLMHAGNRAAVSGDLHVHPQTVSYRMDRVRELIPGQLDDPRRRWELLLALMVEP
jgi:hypothetical protein